MFQFNVYLTDYVPSKNVCYQCVFEFDQSDRCLLMHEDMNDLVDCEGGVYVQILPNLK